MALDKNGNIFITGASEYENYNYNYTTIGYTPGGEMLNLWTYDGPAKGYDVAWDMVFDNAGNLYVTGFSQGIETGMDFATVKYALLDPSNKNNPFDFVGEYHNLGLEYIIDNKEIIGTDSALWHLNITKLALEFGCDNKKDIEKKTKKAMSVLKGKQGNVQCGMSDIEHEYLSNIFHLIYNIDFTELSINSTMIKIISLEDKILKSNKLTKQQKANLLSVTSIARYSLTYWYEEFQKETNEWIEFFKPNTKRGRFWDKWFKPIGIADCGGFITGFLVGGLNIGSGLAFGITASVDVTILAIDDIYGN